MVHQYWICKTTKKKAKKDEKDQKRVAWVSRAPSSSLKRPIFGILRKNDKFSNNFRKFWNLQCVFVTQWHKRSSEKNEMRYLQPFPPKNDTIMIKRTIANQIQHTLILVITVKKFGECCILTKRLKSKRNTKTGLSNTIQVARRFKYTFSHLFTHFANLFTFILTNIKGNFVWWSR